jgi:hypothetical protein
MFANRHEKHRLDVHQCCTHRIDVGVAFDRGDLRSRQVGSCCVALGDRALGDAEWGQAFSDTPAELARSIGTGFCPQRWTSCRMVID